jgi:hypothetical protein
VGDRQESEDGLALRGDLDQHLAVVQGVAVSADQAERRQAVDEPDDGMVLELELPGEGADRRQSVRRKPLDGEQQLVLLRLQSGLAGGPFAEHHEAPQEMAEMGEVLIIRLAQLRDSRRHGPRKYIVVRYIVKREEVKAGESSTTVFLQINPSSPVVLPV